MKFVGKVTVLYCIADDEPAEIVEESAEYADQGIAVQS